jgi:hypothetical protein
MSETMSRRRGNPLDADQIVAVHRGIDWRATSAFDQRCLLLSAVRTPPSTLGLSMDPQGRHERVHIIAKRAIKQGVVTHRTAFARPALCSGPLRLLRPARLACDLARFLGDDDLESIIERCSIIARCR